MSERGRISFLRAAGSCPAGLPHAPARTLALVGAALGLLGCAGSGSREPPREELLRWERFAAAARSHAAQAAWRELADPAAPVGPPSGLLPLTLFSEDDARRLEAACADEQDVRALRRLRAAAHAAQAQADEATRAALSALRLARADRDAAIDQDAIDRALLEAGTAELRREAWMRVHAAGARLAPLVRDVARARNAWAAMRGGGAVAPPADCDPATIERLRAQASLALAPRAGEALADPWDAEAADPALASRLAAVLDEARCVPRARAVLERLGLAHSPGLIVVEGGAARGFSVHATHPVDPPRDVRVQVLPGAGIPAHWACLHELGHAAQALLVPPDARPLDRVPGSGAIAEGCAKIVERLAFAPEWLREQGVAETDIAALASWERASELARGRDILADVAFEDALYEAPESDLDATWTRLRAEIAAETAPVPEAWASERSAALEPGRRIDYLLARCAQAATYRRLRLLPGGLLGDEAMRALRRDVLEPAGRLTFEQWFEGAAGTPPSCDAWLEDVVGSGSATGR